MITPWDLHGKQRWQLPYIGKPITHVMSVDPGSFFVLLAQGGTMIALDARTGQERWQVASGANDGFQIIVQPTLIWMINQGTGSIMAFDRNGTLRWSLAGPSGVNEAVIEEQ